MQIAPYLNFNGNCAEAFKFYQSCLGGDIPMTMTYGESPMADQTPAEHRDRIMHTRLVSGDFVLMGSDAPPGRFENMKGCMISISVDDPKDAERVYNGLTAGGTVQMELQETFWASRFGMFTDRFGVAWMVNCERKP